MSNAAKIVIGILVAIIVLACCAIAAILLWTQVLQPEETSTPVPTAAATVEPGAEDPWDRIQAAGKIIVGTSVDYPPFEFFTEDHQIDGFDIALMDEIGRRLGIQVEYRNFAFDGLGNALVLGQIDAAIAALSITPEREGIADFSNVYFVGVDGVLARNDYPLDPITSADQLTTEKVGVQRATVQAGWAQTNLVDAGILPADNLLVYEKADDAVRDLEQGRVDLVILDSQAADAFALAGSLKVVAQGLDQQRFAIAMPKGATKLKAEVDRTLTDLSNEGVIAQLAKEYLDLEPENILPTPTPTPQPAVTSTPVPPPSCIDGLALVQHLNYDDGNMSNPPEMKPGQPFTKSWRVQNTGTCTWDSSYTLVYAWGNNPAAQMGGRPTAVQGIVEPGQTYDISVDLVAPVRPGRYQAQWQMENGKGGAFGERLPVGIVVMASATATPQPTQTPAPNIVFTVDRDHIKAGECVTFYWKVQNVKAVYFYSEGEDWRDHGVAGEASQQECPPYTLTYYLRVVNLNNSVDTRQIAIYVEEAPDAPLITRFTVDPPNQITLGQCVTIRWTVEGAVDDVTLTANDAVLWQDAPLKGNVQDCPTSAGQVAYRVTAVGPGGTSQRQENISVVGQATATPAPTAPPDDPVIYTFTVTPAEISAGQCVNITWSTGGGTSWVTIVRGEDIIWDNAPLSGNSQDCPEAPGTYDYRLVAFNPQDERTRADQTVVVTE